MIVCVFMCQLHQIIIQASTLCRNAQQNTLAWGFANVGYSDQDSIQWLLSALYGNVSCVRLQISISKCKSSFIVGLNQPENLHAERWAEGQPGGAQMLYLVLCAAAPSLMSVAGADPTRWSETAVCLVYRPLVGP